MRRSPRGRQRLRSARSAGHRRGGAREFAGRAGQLSTATTRAAAAGSAQHAAALAAEAAALCRAGRLDDAAAAYRRLVELTPTAGAFNELGLLLLDLGRGEEALGVFAAGAGRYPGEMALRINRGVACEKLRRIGDAIAVYEEALSRDARLGGVWSNLAGLYNLQGRSADALALYRRALEAAPHDARCHSNLLLAMNYGDSSVAEIFAEHRRWAERHAPAGLAGLSLVNPRDPERRLRVGYVSPDFCMHPVALFIGGVIAAHDRGRFEVFCYSATRRPDQLTDTFRRLPVAWRDIAALDDAAAAALIRADGIDVLVDLAGHTAGNRLLVLARRPAPVQATYLGYPNTTGMPAIDYRLTDAWADPPGAGEAACSETLERLPGGFLAYQPPANAPPVRALPAAAAGGITFGSFNNLAKLSGQSVALWSRVLAAVPGSRLLIKSRSLRDAATLDRFRRLFAAEGVARDRLLLTAEPTAAPQHLDTWNRVDIALDTVPYNGTTTTCEALWMGVPVVALAGNRHAARVGVSLLNAAGLPELVADTPDAFVATAAALAGDLAALGRLRATLRGRLARAPLLDASRLTREIERAYRSWWRRFCGESGDPGPGRPHAPS